MAVDETKPEQQSETNQGDQNHDDKKQEKTPVSPRAKLLLWAGVAVALAIVIVWWLHSRTYEDTDDAQIDGHLNAVAARVDGTVKAIYVDDNQVVHAGQPLLDLDTADAEAKLTQAQAQYDQALAQLSAQQPNLPITQRSNATDALSYGSEVSAAQAALAGAQNDRDSAVAKLQQAEATNIKNQSDLARYRQLLDREEIAPSDYDQYLATARAQEASVQASRASADSSAKTVDQRRAQLDEQVAKLAQIEQNAPLQLSIKSADIKSQQANVESAKAQLITSKLNLQYCQIVSPVDGIVSERSVELGGRISTGQQLLIVAQTSDLWVTANFKETQMKKMKPGQSVRITVDAFGQTFDGYVEGLPAATGDRTSVLPPENATGNYVKVVQRLPVRIRFKGGQSGLERLRPGMSVTPKVLY
ncbi:HlyD family secretion protein [Tunturibacter empetritectus]|uniref:HlyD family secretion protein n=1 Tax=Tunturiibacter empetritectus TaxID=3069691 RepID=A0AAU7ZGR5_9BACT